MPANNRKEKMLLGNERHRSAVSILTTVSFICVVATVVLSVTDEGWKSTKAGATLKTPRLTFEFSC